MAKDKMATFGEKVGGGRFYPETERIPLQSVMDAEVTVVDAEVRTSREYDSEYALMLVEHDTGARAVVLCGGQVVVRKVREAKAGEMLPLRGTIQRVQADSGREYYDIV